MRKDLEARFEKDGVRLEVTAQKDGPPVGLPVNVRVSGPDEVQVETTAFAKVVESRAKRGREDLRDLPLVTIDGEDARDFDDDSDHRPRHRDQGQA